MLARVCGCGGVGSGIYVVNITLGLSDHAKFTKELEIDIFTY
jgi:hypothetical protein